MQQLAPPAELSALAAELFGDRLDLACAYAEILRTDGAEQGLIGPREVDRVWERHIINCALMARGIDTTPAADALVVEGDNAGLTVADIGSGAGLPGLVLAIARPQVQFTLIETMQRRVNFLNAAVEKLGLKNVEVVRSRAEELHGKRYFDVVTARAVAALDKLATWALPLVKAGGQMVAMKGQSAAEEISKAEPALSKLGIAAPVAQIELISDPAVEVPTTLVRIKVEELIPPKGAAKNQSKAVAGKAKRKNAKQKGKSHG